MLRRSSQFHQPPLPRGVRGRSGGLALAISQLVVLSAVLMRRAGVLRGLLVKRLLASERAEIVRLPLIVRFAGRGLLVHVHAAYWIFGHLNHLLPLSINTCPSHDSGWISDLEAPFGLR